MQYLKGGTFAATVPVGAVVSMIQSQLAQGADWMKTLEWAMSMAELNEKLTGATANLGYVVFGQLGGLNQFSGFVNAAAAEAARDTQLSSPEWMPMFHKGGEFAVAGSVLSRQMKKSRKQSVSIRPIAPLSDGMNRLTPVGHISTVHNCSRSIDGV